MEKMTGKIALDVTAASHIISAIDLGPESGNVLSYAGYFASGTRAPLTLLYVIDYLLTPPSYLTSYIEEERRRDEAQIKEWQARLASKGIQADYVIKLGRLHESFLKAIRETSADLLVIGYSSHLLRPSSSERVIRSVPVSMLVVRGKKTGATVEKEISIKRILCPVDFSEASVKALSLAKAYAALFSAELKPVHIVPSHLLKEKFKEREDNICGQIDEAMHAETRSKLDALRDKFGIAAGEICHGRPGEKISALAAEYGCDLIVMGARGQSSMEAVLVGSTTEAVLRSSPCPLMIVH